MSNLFVYGSLMYDDVWKRLIKPPYKRVGAELADHIRLAVRGETYPGLIAKPGSSTPGVLILNIGIKDLQLLDRFEGEYYQRERVNVHVENQVTPAYAYVFKQRYRRLLSQEEWSEQEFKRRGLSLFIKRYTGMK